MCVHYAHGVYTVHVYIVYSEAVGHVLRAVPAARLAGIRRVWAGIPAGPCPRGRSPSRAAAAADTRSDREDARTAAHDGSHDGYTAMRGGDRDHITTIMNQFTDEYFYHAADYHHHPAEYGPAAATYNGYHHPVKNEAEYYLGQSPAAVDPYGYDAAGYCSSGGGYGPYDTVAACNGGSWSSSQEYSSGADGQPPYGCGWTPDHGPQLPQAPLPIPPPSPAHVPEPLADFGDDHLHRRSIVENGFQPDRGSGQTATVTDQLLFSKYNIIW